MNIPFNRPFATGKEVDYIKQAMESGKISGDGIFTKKCNLFFEEMYGFQKVLLTTSCTDALEMAAILIDVKPGDEIIAPSFTFVSTVNAFVLRGAKIVFVDSQKDNPNMDVSKIEDLITPKTKAIIPVHYAGFACDMDSIMDLARKYNLYVIEDAAQAIDSYYTGADGVKRPLGSIGHLSAFSFHETKNVISGEGGMLVINDSKFNDRAEIIREKGTNRSQFFRGEIDKYGWVDIGSSFLPSDIIAAFLFAQLESIDFIQSRRKAIWEAYYNGLQILEHRQVARLPKYAKNATNNAHMFYIVCREPSERASLIEFLKRNGIHAVFHYISLDQSTFFISNNGESAISYPNSDLFSNCLLRLPMYCDLKDEEVNLIKKVILDFYNS